MTEREDQLLKGLSGQCLCGHGGGQNAQKPDRV